jgi:3-methyl-2-oxobutanoate hydroxymethyltransferase
MRTPVKTIYDKKATKEKIAVLTAYDFPMARTLDEAGVDVILVGDSLGMVVLGYDSTVPVTMRDMLHHTRAVSRAVKKALVVADMPFGSYDTPEKALRNALRLVKEGGADAVKLEGGAQIEKQVRCLVQAGVPVMGHVGLTPQTASLLGGYRVQGRNAKQADKIFKEAALLESAGVFSIVLECVPSALTRKITRRVKCPTIGIGAGADADGQVLVLNDMLGFESSVSPKFVRRYAHFGAAARKAAVSFIRDVKEKKFPSAAESFE